MKNYFMESLRAVGLVVLMLLVHVPVADAEPERYDFPVRSQKAWPVALLAHSMPLLGELPPNDLRTEDVRQGVVRQNEARKKSIAALFQQYNRKLDEQKARDYATFIMQACEQFKQDPFVIAAMIVNESSARSDAISSGGDYGLMQVRWRVHQKKIRKKYPNIEEADDMLNPQYNVLVGTEIFSVYHATAKQDIRGALMYYTAGNERHADKVFAVLSRLEKAYNEHMKDS